MKLKEITKFILVVGSISVLAACSSGRKPQGDVYALDDSAENYSVDDGAETAGAGQDAGFKKAKLATTASNDSSAARRTYYFDFDSNVVHDNDKPAIEANAQKISKGAQKVMLEGHTDPRGSREYNIGLGERRAKSVADELRTNGVNPKQVRLVSYGAEKPAAKGHSEEDYQLNRRVVLVYTR